MSAQDASDTFRRNGKKKRSRNAGIRTVQFDFELEPMNSSTMNDPSALSAEGVTNRRVTSTADEEGRPRSDSMTTATTIKDEIDDRSVSDLTSNIRPGLYGWGSFTPRWLQIFNKPQWLLACFCFAVFSSTLAGALMPAITDTLERRFHLNSVRSGLLNSAYDIASLLIVLFVCHYGERGHKGKWIGIGAIVYGIGSCVMTIPHYVTGPYHSSGGSPDAIQHNATCPADYPQEICDAGAMRTAGNPSWAYYILLTGQAVRGFGGTCLGTLMLAYIDENVPQRTSPMYLSIISVVGLIAMALGYLTGGQLLQLYGDFDRVPKDQWPSMSDPNWYGCWWLGYYVAAAGAFLISMPLLGFPRELPSKVQARQMDREQTHNEDKVRGTGFARNWSEIPKMTWHLIKNPVFTCFTLRNTLETMFASGWGVFMPKYLQNMFGMQPAYSAMITGAICLGPVMAGTLFGGWVIKRFNWKVRGVLFFGFITTVLGSFSSMGIFFICTTRLSVGANVDYGGNAIPKGSAVLLNPCNLNCSCDTTNYVPVCFTEARLTYFSPCFAGCEESESENGQIRKYKNCKCLREYFPSISPDDSVQVGECPQDHCTTEWNGFVGTWVITCLFFGMSGMPLIQSFLRAVPFEQRTLALGLQSIPMRLLGTVPGPILMGLLFDYSCILWKEHCSENLSCLQYDNQTMMRLVVYVGLFFRITSCTLLATAIIHYRPPKTKSTTSSNNYGGATINGTVDEHGSTDFNEASIADALNARLRRLIRRGKPPAA